MKSDLAAAFTGVNSTTGSAALGTWNDAGVVGYGIKLSSSTQFGFQVSCDDGGVALPTNWYSAIFGQTLIGADAGSINTSASGVAGECHLGSANTPGGNYSGIYATIDFGAFTIKTSTSAALSAIHAEAWVNDGSTLSGSGVASCLSMKFGSQAGTHTAGKTAFMQILPSGDGSVDYFMFVNCVSLSTSISGHATMTKALKIYIDGAVGYIPWMTDTT
jgi:hypothetical protein